MTTVVQVAFSRRTKLNPSMRMGKQVREDGGYASSILLLCRPQPGVVINVTLSARFRCSARLQLYQACLHLELQLLQPIQKGVQTRMGEPKTAVEAAVKAFGMVCSSWPYIIVMRPQTRGKFARDPGTAEVGCYSAHSFAPVACTSGRLRLLQPLPCITDGKGGQHT